MYLLDKYFRQFEDFDDDKQETPSPEVQPAYILRERAGAQAQNDTPRPSPRRSQKMPSRGGGAAGRTTRSATPSVRLQPGPSRQQRSQGQSSAVRMEDMSVPASPVAPPRPASPVLRGRQPRASAAYSGGGEGDVDTDKSADTVLTGVSYDEHGPISPQASERAGEQPPETRGRAEDELPHESPPVPADVHEDAGSLDPAHWTWAFAGLPAAFQQGIYGPLNDTELADQLDIDEDEL